jgi:predicted RND superfamily exporter protein
MNHFLDRLAAFLIAARWPLFGLALLLAAAAYYPAQQVRFDRSIENMFAPDDPLLPPYQRLKEDFGGNEIVMAVFRDDNLLAEDGSGIQRLAAISSRMRDVPGVMDVLSLAEVNKMLEVLETGKGNRLLGMFRRPRTWNGPAILNPDSPVAARYRELFAGYTHSHDGKTVAVVCMLQPPQQEPQSSIPAASSSRDAHEDPRAATIRDLRSIITDLPDGLAPGVLAGEPVMVVEGFSLLEQDGNRLGRWSTLLLGLTILVCFRSLRWLIAPIAVVQWSVLLTRATLVWSGLQLSMVSSMLTAIVTVVGVATVVHLIVRFRELRDGGLSPRDALHQSLVLLTGPIVGAIATDVAGFGSLWWASVGPVQDFGTMTVVGSLLVLPATALLIPAIALLGSRDAATAASSSPGRLAAGLAHSITMIRARSKTVAAVTLVVTLVLALGAVRLENETDFTRNFRRGSRIVEAYEFVETNLGGAGVWDVIVPAPAVLDKEYAARVRGLEEQLRAIELPDPATGQTVPALTKVIGLIDAFDAVEADRILALAPLEVRYQGMLAAMPAFTSALLTPELDEAGQGRLRIMLRARERQPAEQKEWLIGEVTRLASEAFPPSVAGRGTVPTTGAEVTGFFVLLTNLIKSMIRDQWTTFGLATAGIFLIIFASFRSLRLALIALVPNALPIFVVMGLMGWITLLGIAELKINMGAAMIAAVSMGLSVDSSIHYLVAYRRGRRAGQTVAESLTAVQQSVGQAMIFSTLALIIGFSVLCSSEFVPTAYFGALVSLAMLGGMLGNLIVLPLLISWTERDSQIGADRKEKHEDTKNTKEVARR